MGEVRRPAVSALLTLAVSFGVIAWMGWHWWPHWGLAFAVEDAPLAWWQAALLVANASIAGALACVHAGCGDRRAAVRWWTLLALGMLFAALDERFMAHEAVQDWLEYDLGWPRRAAQSVILAYALGGLVLLHVVWTEGSPALRRWTVATLVTGAAAIALDLAFDTIALQIAEEGLEALAETLLLAGLISELGSAASRRR
jgi:hypothetical protein